jgi:hypothetical protein
MAKEISRQSFILSIPISKFALVAIKAIFDPGKHKNARFERKSMLRRIIISPGRVFPIFRRSATQDMLSTNKIGLRFKLLGRFGGEPIDENHLWRNVIRAIAVVF